MHILKLNDIHNLHVEQLIYEFVNGMLPSPLLSILNVNQAPMDTIQDRVLTHELWKITDYVPDIDEDWRYCEKLCCRAIAEGYRQCLKWHRRKYKNLFKFCIDCIILHCNLNIYIYFLNKIPTYIPTYGYYGIGTAPLCKILEQLGNYSWIYCI